MTGFRHCGYELPPSAAFCPICGAALAAGASEARPTASATARAAPSGAAGVRAYRGLIPLYAIGLPLLLVPFLFYLTLAINPGSVLPPGQPLPADPVTLRTSALFLAGLLAVMLAVQALSLVGLLMAASWSRVAVTFSSVLWMLTCLGLPVALWVIWRIWTRPGGGSTGPG